MNKRVFVINKDCFIIYTGQSSADDRGFLRIGNTGNLDRIIQESIGYIVVNDANKIDYAKEKNDISYMEKGKIRYICNDENQSILFSNLEKFGVNESDLYHKTLSKDLRNINRIDNKKHFFTVFYENKNIKIVCNDEVYFDLFNSNSLLNSNSLNINFEEENNRLIKFIETLKTTKKKYISNKTLEATRQIIKDNYIQIEPVENIDKLSLFIIQERNYIPLNFGMFHITDIKQNRIFIEFNSSNRFFAGKDVYLSIIKNGTEMNNIESVITKVEVIESQILYNYQMEVIINNSDELNLILNIYLKLFEKV